MFEIIVKTVLAHLIGEVIIQKDKAIEDLRNRKFKSKYLYLNFGTRFLILLILTKTFIPSLILSSVQLIIYIITKFYFNNTKYRIQIFCVDQFLHFSSIALFVCYLHKYTILWEEIFNVKNYILIITLITLTTICALIIKMIMPKILSNNAAPSNPNALTNPYNISTSNTGLGNDNAGRIIGMLERLFIFGFVVSNFWEGIGFLLAAKSIFRFGDLKENKEIKQTEYILIGTLISFGLAIVISKIYLNILKFC